MRVAVMATLAASVLLGAAAPAGAAPPRQVGSLTYTSTVPGAPTGLRLNLEFQNPEDPALKPHSVARMVVHRPAGGVIDTTVPPQCGASDAELFTRGHAACPPETQVGSAVAVNDTGGRDPFPRHTRTFIRNFNNRDEVIGAGENEDLPIRPFDRTRIEGNRTTSNFAAFPGAPPPDPYSALKTLQFEFPPYVRDGRAYNRTPPTCPATGHWTFKIEFTYRDGVTETVESRSPCEQPPALTIGHRDVIVQRGSTLVKLRCAGAPGARCGGTLRLEPTRHPTRIGRAAAPRTVEFGLAAGSKKRVRVQVPIGVARADRAQAQGGRQSRGAAERRPPRQAVAQPLPALTYAARGAAGSGTVARGALPPVDPAHRGPGRCLCSSNRGAGRVRP